MKYIPRILAAVLTLTTYILLSRASSHEPPRREGGFELGFTILGKLIYGGAFVTFPFIIRQAFQTEPTFRDYSLAATVASVCLSLFVFDLLSLRITVTDETITIKKFFRKRTMNISDIHYVRKTWDESFRVVFHNGRGLTLLPTISGLNWFLDFLKAHGVRIKS